MRLGVRNVADPTYPVLARSPRARRENIEATVASLEPLIFSARVPDRWNMLHQWSKGTRSLIVVDEALANAVDHCEATSGDLDVVLRAIPYELRGEYPLALKTLETLKSYLDSRENKKALGCDASKMLWGEGAPEHAKQIRGLRGVLRETAFDTALYNEEAQETVDSILEDVEVMLDGYAFYY